VFVAIEREREKVEETQFVFLMQSNLSQILCKHMKRGQERERERERVRE
jgi:hypothetical protein